MARISSPLMLAAVLLFASAAHAAVWEYGSEAAKAYEASSLDVLAVQDALRTNETKPVDYETAQSVYADGLNVAKESGSGAVGFAEYYSAKDILTATYKGAPMHDAAVAYYKKPAPFNFLMETAFNNTKLCCGVRTGTLNAGMKAWPFYWTFVKLSAAQTEASKARRNTQAIKRAVDEAVALWTGSEEGVRGSPMGTAEGYAARRCTNASTVAGVNSTNNAMFLEGAKAFETAALKGDKAGMDKSMQKMASASTGTLLQAFIYNFEEAVSPPDGYVARAPVCLTACGQSVAEGISQAKKGSAAAYWYFLAPTLARNAANETRAVHAALTSTKRLDMNAGRALLPQIESAATKAGVNWKAQVSGCDAY